MAATWMIALVAVAVLTGPRAAAAQAPGGLVESATSTTVRPRPTAAELQTLLPDRGRFIFPAPYNTIGVRLTNATDCAGSTDCVSPLAGSRWQMMNNSTGSDFLYVALQLDRSNGGVGPSIVRYNKSTGETVNLGPLFDDADARSWSSMEGWHFSATQPSSLYLNAGAELQRYDILTHATTTVFDITADFGANVSVWHAHSSNNDVVHSFVPLPADGSSPLGCGLYREDTHQFSFVPAQGIVHECEIDRSGQWLLVKEDRTGTGVDDNRIINLALNTQTVLLAANGAAGMSDLGFGMMVAVDASNALPNAIRTWSFGPLTPGAIVYHSLAGLPPSMTQLSFASATTGALDQQYVCGAAVNRNDGPRANEIICARLDGSLSTLVVAPVMTDLDALGGGPDDDCIKQPYGMLDPTGEYFLWLSNVGSDRIDAFLAYVPAPLLLAPPVSASGPSITGVTASAITAHQATIAWTTDTPADGKIDFGPTAAYGWSTLLNPALTTAHVKTLTGLVAGTTYHYRVTSRNSAGIATTSEDFTFTTIGAPIMSGITVSAITLDGATIGWTTDQGSTSEIEYGPTAGYGRTMTNRAMLCLHGLTLHGLSAGTTYHYRVRSTNAAGLRTTSGDRTFTTIAPPPPVIRGISAIGITRSSATIVWATDQRTRGRVEYGTTTAYGRATDCDDDLGLLHAETLRNLTAGTTYHFRVKATNRDGKVTTSADGTFKTLPLPAPAIGDIRVTDLTRTAATIRWHTDQKATSQVEFGLTVAYGRTTTLERALVTGHDQRLTGLVAGTTYHFRVKSTNADGTSTVSGDFTFRTPTVTDHKSHNHPHDRDHDNDCDRR